MFHKYSYDLYACKLNISGSDYDLNKDKFIELKIINHFRINIAPYISLVINLPKHLVNKVLLNQKPIKILLDIVQIESDENNNVVSKSSYIKKSFEADITTDLNSFEVNKHATDSDMDFGKLDNEMMVEFILYNTEDINIFKIESNYIFKNANAGTALTKFLQDRGVKNNVVASIPVIRTNRDINIPIGDLMGNISYLHQYYGLYADFPLVYKDIDEFYVIDKNQLPIVLGNMKNVIKIVPEQNGPQNDAAVDKTSDPNCYIVKYMATSIIQDNMNMKHAYMNDGANAIAVKANGSVKKVNVMKDIAKTKVIREYHELSIALALSKESIYRSIDISIQNPCLPLFKPYCKFIFDTKTVRGSYHLFSSTITLTNKVEKMIANIDINLENIED